MEESVFLSKSTGSFHTDTMSVRAKIPEIDSRWK